MKGMLRAEIIRFCNWKKIALVMAAFTIILLMGQYQNIYIEVLIPGGVGIVRALWTELAFDRFKVVLVMLLCSLYVGSFCQDDHTHYGRMILCRADITHYAQARFIVHTIGTVIISILTFFLTAGILGIFFPLISEDENFQIYYGEFAYAHPLLFIAFMAMQFGLLTAAFGSIGLLLSSFQPDTFVCIAATGLIFFVAASYTPDNSPFNVLDIISLAPAFTRDMNGAKILDVAWGILYPLVIIGICGFLFERRLRWRNINGNI